MRTFSRTPQDDISFYDTFWNRRTKPDAAELTGVRPQIIQAYSLYQRTAMVYQIQPATVSQAQKSALHAAYKRLSNRNIHGELMAASDVCYICNERDACELDHFLPKELFPELSLFGGNLIPVCRQCNISKGTRVTDTNGHGAYFHPHKCNVNRDEAILFAEVHDIRTGARFTFSVRQSENISTDQFRLIDNQFRISGMNAYYSTCASKLLSSQNIAIREEGFRGEKAVYDYLDQQARTRAGDLGRNHWAPAMFRALADSKEFCAGGYRNVIGSD